MRTIPLRIIRAFQSLRPVLHTSNRSPGNSQVDNGLALVKQEHTPRRFRLGAMTYDPDRVRLCQTSLRSGIDLAQHERMPSKDFTDASGMSWRVWNTVPVSGAVIN